MNRAMPHVYDVVRGKIYERSINPSDLYASPRGDLFGVAWDIVIPCGAALLATLLFLQQRLGGAASLPSQRRSSGGYELVSNL
jgi:ubiquitin-conjugating enzyme E2 O